MDRNFAASLRAVLKHEGGFVDHEADPGGATNKGITIATYRRFIKRDGTAQDLKALTTEQAGKVYKARYWDRVSGDALPSGIDYATFDFAVNSGPSRAVKYLQRVLGVAQDGVVGPNTLAAARAANASKVVHQLCDHRMSFLKRLSHWGTFGRGWTNRVQGVRALALDMAENAPQPAQEPPKPRPRPDAPDKVETPASGKPAGKAKAVGIGAVILAVLFAVGKALGIF